MSTSRFGKKSLVPRPPGFTIMELLIVVAIIAILAGLVLSTAGFIQNKAARSRTETELAGLENALESYKADMGEYPQTNNGVPTATNANPGSNIFLRQALAPAGATNEYNTLNKIYFSFSKGMGPSSGDQFSVSNNVLDAFGNPYGYKAPGDNNPGSFDLWSTAGKYSNINIRIKNW